jgi:predicted DNA binding CopG/RHH family protein
MKARKLKAMPPLTSDEAADDFVATSDLTEYDLSTFKPIEFEIATKTAILSIRLPNVLLAALKSKAQKKGIPYSRYVRLLLEQDVTQQSL